MSDCLRCSQVPSGSYRGLSRELPKSLSVFLVVAI